MGYVIAFGQPWLFCFLHLDTFCWISAHGPLGKYISGRCGPVFTLLCNWFEIEGNLPHVCAMVTFFTRIQ
jgi:hypothetical protein